MAQKEQKFTKTSFNKQAQVLQKLVNNNPTLEDDEKASLNETAGVLLWLTQLQLHWDAGNEGISDDILLKVFGGREAEKRVIRAAD